MASYSDDQVRLALKLYMDGVPVRSICTRNDMPSAPTFYAWSKEGKFTNGVPWDEHKKRQEELSVAKVRADIATERAKRGATFMEELRDFIEADLFTEMMAKVKAGEVEVKIKDFSEIATLYAMLNNAAGEKMEFATWFMREVFSIAIEIMDERQYALFQNRVMAFQAEIQEKMNPIPAAQLPPARDQ